MTSSALDLSDAMLVNETWSGESVDAPFAADAGRRRSKVASLGAADVRLMVDGEFPEWLETVIQHLNYAAALPANWDTYGARPVNQRTLEHALQVLLKIMRAEDPVPQILATSGGGIQFLWNKPAKEFKVSVNAPFQGDYYYSDDVAGEESEDPFSIEFGEVTQRFRDFTS